MKIQLPPVLHRDLAAYADKRNTSVEALIIDILSTEMMIKKYLTPEDEKIFMDIFRKYLP